MRTSREGTFTILGDRARHTGSMFTELHAMRQHLAVAVGQLEGMLDGKWEPSPVRLQGVLARLRAADGGIERLITEGRRASRGVTEER